MHKLSRYLGIVLLAVPLVNGAPSPSRGADANAAGQSVLQAERDWVKAIMNGDASGISRIEADDFTFVIDSMTGDKNSDLEDAKNKAFTGSVELTDMKPHVYGTTVVVTGKAVLGNAKYKDKDVSGTYLFTDTFVKINGHWQVVASHGSKAPM